MCGVEVIEKCVAQNLTPNNAPLRGSLVCVSRSYYNLSRLNERFERAYVAQAKENVRWDRREKEYLDNERALMGGVEGWVVGKLRYATQWEDKPDRDLLDTRKLLS